MKIGNIALDNPLLLAPMAGVTDKPFRILCRQLGAALCFSEMTSANALLWDSPKTRHRLDHSGEAAPIAVQIAGADPQQMALAARFNVSKGAEIIDINMGCPAKKVCKVSAGSALLKDEALVKKILSAVVQAVDIPVTLKIRTGWDRENKNAITIAQIAEDCGIQALTIHGRTRADKYQGQAEYDTIKAVKKTVSIPIIANGDIDSGQKAQQVLDYTGADAIMIGRSALGNPWIFKAIKAKLNDSDYQPPSDEQKSQLIQHHLNELYQFYGEYKGIRIARKHIAWYCKDKPGSAQFRQQINLATSCQQQLALVARFFETTQSF